jgi:hypothetical protein
VMHSEALWRAMKRCDNGRCSLRSTHRRHPKAGAWSSSAGVRSRRRSALCCKRWAGLELRPTNSGLQALADGGAVEGCVEGACTRRDCTERRRSARLRTAGAGREQWKRHRLSRAEGRGSKRDGTERSRSARRSAAGADRRLCGVGACSGAEGREHMKR